MKRYRPGPMTRVVLIGVLMSSSGLKPLGAQESTDSVRVQLERLTALVDSLRREVERLQGAGRTEEAGDALAQLRAAATAAASVGGAPTPEAPESQQFAGKTGSLQALNPEISVTGDIFGHIDMDDRNVDNFFAREFEIAIQSNLDPYSKARVFIAREVPGGEVEPFPVEGGEEHEEGGGFSVEEGYVQWVGLPGGLGLTMGRFQQRFGTLNKWHSHALPFQTRSLPHLAFMGEEALAQTGASIYWLAPLQPLGGTYEAWVEVTRTENQTLFGGSTRPSLLGHVNAFYQISPSTDFDFGISWVNGTYEDDSHLLDRNLYGAEMAFTWRPPSRARYRGFTMRGGVMQLDGLVAEDDDQDSAIGVWSMGELRLSESWLVGTRVDWTENPLRPEESAWLFSPTLTWWQSEYVRLRVEYDLLGRALANQGRLLFQVTFAMGPHKHETY